MLELPGHTHEMNWFHVFPVEVQNSRYTTHRSASRRTAHMRFSAQACEKCEWWRCTGPSTAKRTFDRTSARKLRKSDRRPNKGKKPLPYRGTRNRSAATCSKLSINHAWSLR